MRGELSGLYLPALREEISQGDIFDGLIYQYVYQESSAPEPVIRSRVIQAMLITADCEFDKPSSAYVYLGEVRPLSEISVGTRGNVRSRRVFYTFPLEPHDNFLEECYVDFRRILRFDKSRLAASHLNQQRLLSLTDTARTALQEQLSVFFGLAR